MQTSKQHYDVVIIGGGLAGLTLSRHLLRESEKRILVLDKSPELPVPRQKYGESSVQVGGYYFSKVLDLEEYLWHEHFMKYNLRFYFKSRDRDNRRFEDYGQAYIRTFSNIPCYQLDRNRFEADLLKMNQADPRFQLVHPATDVDVNLSEADEHTVTYRNGDEQVAITAEWVVDTTGRGRMLARQMDIRETTPIHHGAAFMWVDGIVDIEKLTDSTPREIRLNKDRRATGHIPHWLATNHFMGEGFWFWVIPLRHMTSLGLVYDKNLIDGRQFATAESLRDWACREFPLFARDLPNRKIVDFNVLKSYAHGCKQTISASKWAMSGESGRFTDPLYSPGSDFVALHNTLIVDAILCDHPRLLARKCWLAEMMMQSCYSSLLPTFVTSYDALGDHETFVLKYTWELSVYFTFFVFPFINDLASDAEFIPGYLSRFSRMGAMNHCVQQMVSGYFQWKKAHGLVGGDPQFHDFMLLEPLRSAERTFYHVGLAPDDGKTVIDAELRSLDEFGRYIVAYIYGVVLQDAGVMFNREFVTSIDFKSVSFNINQMRSHWDKHRDAPETQVWTFDPNVLDSFRLAHAREPVQAMTEKAAS